MTKARRDTLLVAVVLLGLAAILSQAGAPVEAKDLGAYAGVRDSRPNTFELWFGQAPLPPACARQSG